MQAGRGTVTHHVASGPGNEIFAKALPEPEFVSHRHRLGDPAQQNKQHLCCKRNGFRLREVCAALHYRIMCKQQHSRRMYCQDNQRAAGAAGMRATGAAGMMPGLGSVARSPPGPGRQHDSIQMVSNATDVARRPFLYSTSWPAAGQCPGHCPGGRTVTALMCDCGSHGDLGGFTMLCHMPCRQ
jgi:hypothetical protein